MTRGPIRLLRPYRAALAGLLALVVVSAGAEAIGLVLLSALLSAIVPGASATGGGAVRDIHRFAEDSPGRFLILLGAVYVSKSLIALWANYASISLGLRMADGWRLRLLHGYLTTPLRRLKRQQGSMLQMVIDEPSAVGSGVAASGVLAQNALSAASVYAALLLLAPVLTLGLTAMAGAATAVVLLLSRYAQRVALRRSLAVSDAYAYITEMLSALKQLRLFGIEAQAEWRAAEHLERTRQLTRASNVIVSSPRLLIEIIFLLGLGLLLGLLLPQLAGGAAMSDVALVVAAAFRILPSLSASAGTWVQMQQAWPGIGRIESELEELEASDAVEQPVEGRSVAFADRIIVEDVHFAYPGREQVLRGIDIEIPQGGFLGIVGPSGAGKSTLVDLLCAFYTPDRGRILVDGTDLREIDPGAWRRKLGVVAQDNFLFSGTIRENLVLLKPTCAGAALQRVVTLVGADLFIGALPEGYDTRVGERGLTLSGGQRQRLALARVLLKGPEILVMDEATSALDVESDELLQDRLQQLRGAMTVIVISHRLNSVRRADRIYVMAEGRIVERGSHEELIRRDDAYAAMWRAIESGSAV